VSVRGLEAIAIVSGTLFDLAAYLYTESVKRSCRAVEAPKFGMIGFNTGAISTEVAPIAGIKQSGLGAKALRH